MKDGISQWADLVAAVLAFIGFLAANAVVFRVYDTALWTSWHIAEALIKHVLQAGIVVRKLLLKLFDFTNSCISCILERKVKYNLRRRYLILDANY